MIAAPTLTLFTRGAEVLVRALKYNGVEYRRWSARVETMTPEQIVLGAVFGPEVEGRTPFRGGDRALEFFYTSRGYNIIAGFSPAGVPRGCYCNICLPAAVVNAPSGGEIHFVDLDIDVLVAPDGTCVVADEDEFAVNARRFAYPEPVRAAARSAVDELLAAVRDRRSPFDRLGLPPR